MIVLQLLCTYAPPLQAIFDTQPLPWTFWPLILLGGAIFFLVVEAEKSVIRSRRAGEPAIATG